MSDNINNTVKIKEKSELDISMESYGRKIYAHLLERCGNKEIAREALKSVLLDMYKSIRVTGCTDPLEALMYSQAEAQQNDLLNKSISVSISDLITSIENESVCDSADKNAVSGNSSMPVQVRSEANPQQVNKESNAPEPVMPIVPENPVAIVNTSSGNPMSENREELTVPERTEPGVHKTVQITTEPSGATRGKRPEETKKVSRPAAENENNDVEEQERSIGFGTVLLLLILIFCIVATVWVIAGLLMSIGYIPQYDLGYYWFNLNIYPLF